MKIKKFLLALVAVVFAPVTFLTGCGHTHDYGTDYQTDATNHWLECSCGEKKDVAGHVDSDTNGACDACGISMEIPEESGCNSGCKGGCDGSIVSSLIGLFTLAATAFTLARRKREE